MMPHRLGSKALLQLSTTMAKLGISHIEDPSAVTAVAVTNDWQLKTP
jgi:hypothetical protein